MFDFSYLRSLSSDPGFVPQMVQVFLNVVPTQVDALKKALDNDDTLQAGLVLHQLKPSMQTFGCNALVPEIIALEQMAKAGDSPSNHANRYHQLVQHIEQGITTLKQINEQDFRTY